MLNCLLPIIGGALLTGLQGKEEEVGFERLLAITKARKKK